VPGRLRLTRQIDLQRLDREWLRLPHGEERAPRRRIERLVRDAVPPRLRYRVKGLLRGLRRRRAA